MDISAPANERHGRIVCFHPDGRRTVYAEKLHAVFGMQYLEGKLYVLHNPFFTVFRDGGDQGEEPENLIESTNPNPWALDWNDHVPANFKLAMDGYFYMAVGDKGIFGAKGKDGRKVFLRGGGILRLKPDGTGLEVYATGVRNILDVALTTEDEIFTYDNTDEHDWMGRLTHMVEGGFYGYPHDFIPRRPYTLWMMHDFGGGAATGVFANTEDGLPREYRDNLFLADFGKRQILRVIIERAGATFKVARHEEMFADMPDSFRPVGIAPSADGRSIYICDWQHRDTKEAVETGRLWKLTFTNAVPAPPRPDWYQSAALGRVVFANDASVAKGLEHPSKSVRLAAQRLLTHRMATNELRTAATNTNELARWHAIWGLQALGRRPPLPTNGSANLVRQALRAGALNPVGYLDHREPSIRFQAATALGRIGASNAVELLLPRLYEQDTFARFAVFHALNRIGRAHPVVWPDLVASLANGDVRSAASHALRETWDTALLEALRNFASDPARPSPARAEAVTLIAQAARKFPEWTGDWWAYHPALAAAPKKTDAWEGTEAALGQLRASLSDAHPEVRLAAVRAIAAIGEKSLAAPVRERFASEGSAAIQNALLQTLAALRDESAAPLVARILSGEPSQLTLEAVRAAVHCDSAGVRSALEILLGKTIPAETRAETVRALGQLRAASSERLVAREASSPELTVRAAALRALGRIGGTNAIAALRGALEDPNAEMRREALSSLAELKDASTVPDLLKSWQSAETKEAALDALLRIPDLRAMDAYVDALGSANPATRERTRKALEPIKGPAWQVFKERLPALKPLVVAELQKLYPEMRDMTLTFTTPVIRSSEEFTRHALNTKGDPARGRKLFFDETGVACIRCHTVGSEGRAVGPDMTSIGAQFPRNALIEHIVTPSKSVREGYQQVQIETDDDESISGLIKAESAEELTILDGQARLHTIPKRQITRRSQSELSLMPEGLHVGLSLDEFADLIAYLESLKGAR